MKAIIVVMLTAALLCGCQKAQEIPAGADAKETVELKETRTEKFSRGRQSMSAGV